ncbi:MAG: magnesium protoporphyrin IX methyltransferase [Halieaceae bacterium]|jgi:magnesium-protoporphyrin O-methyltransferase|nr:magnesium protoporphyrin IX methyltransferase [Halieaceae bacterium]
MTTAARYQQRREEIEHYFDRTAAATWARLTSDEPVGRIRQTVRAGRDAMRANLLSWLPDDLSGKRILDAGCGTGALAIEAAQRGASVVAIDLSPTLVELARERHANTLGSENIEFLVGDMRHLELGVFDHVVAMDSLIHYDPDDGLATLAAFANQVTSSIVFTYAPRTPLLAVMHAAGQWFPRGNRSPAIVPVAKQQLHDAFSSQSEFDDWRIDRQYQVSSGFYISSAMELTR